MQTGKGFNRIAVFQQKPLSLLDFGSLPPGFILRVSCQFLDDCSPGLGPGCPPNSLPPPVHNDEKGTVSLVHSVAVSSEWKGVGVKEVPSLALLEPEAKEETSTILMLGH